MELAPLSLSAPFHNYDEHVNEQGAHSGEEKASSLLGLGLEAHQFSRTEFRSMAALIMPR